MAFHAVRFPPEISYGSRGGPGYNTSIITVDSGAEERNARWAGTAGKRTYDARYGIKRYEQLSTVLAFYIAVNGPSIGFRWKDWSDCKTDPDNSTHKGTIAFDDQVIAVADGTTAVFQLRKSYTNTIATRIRIITKPVAGTVAIGKNGANMSSGWSLNYETGELTLSPLPNNGDVITWGGEFDVPVRFGAELDKALSISLDDFGSGSLDSLPIVELIEEGDNPEEYFYGGGDVLTSATSISLSISDGRALGLNLTAASQNVTLPDETDLPLGGPYFFLVNTGANTFTLKSHGGTTIRTVAAAAILTVWLGLDNALAKKWYTT